MVIHLFLRCIRGTHSKPSLKWQPQDSEDEASLTARQERKRKLDHDKETQRQFTLVQRISPKVLICTCKIDLGDSTKILQVFLKLFILGLRLPEYPKPPGNIRRFRGLSALYGSCGDFQSIQ